jgi:hypothetical protein
MACQCFGEEVKESIEPLGKGQMLIGQVASLLWYMEKSSGYGKMNDRDRSRPLTIPFRVDRQVLVLHSTPRKRSKRLTAGRSLTRISKR